MQEEAKYLRLVEEKLAGRIEELNEELAEGAREVEEMHDYFWENYTEMDEYGYENYDNSQALLQQVNSNNRLLDLRRKLRKMQDSPYFGRVDFLYEGEDQPESHYIGIANFAERDGMKPYVFDWRAPVSGLFYDYEKGPASYEAPRGDITGEITSKWQYKIRRGELVYAVESDFKVDDDILQEELSKHGSVQLKNIVRTIQKEQNAIIRNTKDPILVLQGAAGSGKTSIALHRIAYLLYHDRNRLKANDVLILSPNRVFSNYISTILPELGEENIREMSFDFFAWKELRGIAPDCEDCLDALERRLSAVGKRHRKGRTAQTAREAAAGKTAVIAGGDGIPAGEEAPQDPERIWDKSSKEYAGEIYGFVLELEDDLMRITDIHYKKLHKTAAELRELFYWKFPELPLLTRMDAVMEYVVDEAETLAGRDFSDPDKQAIRDKFAAMYETRDIYRLYRRFQKKLGLKPLPNVKPEKRRVPYEDLYPMLFLKYQLEGCGSRRKMRHLIIDEMQDYSYIQYQIIAKLFSCRMTIVGDRCQTMGSGARDVTRFLPEIFGKNILLLSLNKSYRNTVEIAEYAQGLIGETGIENFGRHGRKPVHCAAATPADAVRAVLRYARTEGLNTEQAQEGADEDRSFETCAVICLTEAEAEKIYGLLKTALAEQGYDTGHGLTFVNRNSERFSRGITVTTFYMAKGLEFDQVFSWFPETGAVEDSGDAELAGLLRQARYIAATRALHELYLLEESADSDV